MCIKIKITAKIINIYAMRREIVKKIKMAEVQYYTVG